MPRVLIVDDDDAMRKMIRQRLQGDHEILDTNDPTEALGLALEHKPDCILLDLNMPRFSGLELCQTFCALSHTRLIPILVISGQSAEEYKESCLNLGATEFFKKPLDFNRLKARLDAIAGGLKTERRGEIRVRLKVVLKLVGTDPTGKEFELLTYTDDVSLNGFFCRCALTLERDTVVKVFQSGPIQDRYVGTARLAHVEWPDLPWQSCGFMFIEKVDKWIM
jgi:CheY-like chemotaxis protein